MRRDSELYQKYIDIMRRELLPAMGCTEPIAISYAAATLKACLGQMPEHVTVEASGNLIKNVKSVIVPNTGGLKGIETAAAAGLVAGKPEKLLEVIGDVSEQQKEEIQNFPFERIEVKIADSDIVFDLCMTGAVGDDTAKVRIVNEHTNIVYIEKNK